MHSRESGRRTFYRDGGLSQPKLRESVVPSCWITLAPLPGEGAAGGTGVGAGIGGNGGPTVGCVGAGVGTVSGPLVPGIVWIGRFGDKGGRCRSCFEPGNGTLAALPFKSSPVLRIIGSPLPPPPITTTLA